MRWGEMRMTYHLSDPKVRGVERDHNLLHRQRRPELQPHEITWGFDPRELDVSSGVDRARKL